MTHQRDGYSPATFSVSELHTDSFFACDDDVCSSYSDQSLDWILLPVCRGIAPPLGCGNRRERNAHDRTGGGDLPHHDGPVFARKESPLCRKYPHLSWPRRHVICCVS